MQRLEVQQVGTACFFGHQGMDAVHQVHRVLCCGDPLGLAGLKLPQCTFHLGQALGCFAGSRAEPVVGDGDVAHPQHAGRPGGAHGGIVYVVQHHAQVHQRGQGIDAHGGVVVVVGVQLGVGAVPEALQQSQQQGRTLRKPAETIEPGGRPQCQHRHADVLGAPQQRLRLLGDGAPVGLHCGNHRVAELLLGHRAGEGFQGHEVGVVLQVRPAGHAFAHRGEQDFNNVGWQHVTSFQVPGFHNSSFKTNGTTQISTRAYP